MRAPFFIDQARSGPHTYTSFPPWLTGKKAIAAGYSLPAVQSGEEAFPWHWHDAGGDFSVRFTVGREDETIRWFSGRLE